MLQADRSAIRRWLFWFPRFLDYVIRKYFLRAKFRFQGEFYHYFCHWHGSTWRSERAVEIPIIWRVVQDSGGKEILEVGNVLSNYFPVSHDVLDKYEKACGVINEDAETFHREKPYDLIVSISTIEHIGWNGEEQQDAGKIMRCINNLVRLLADGGVLLFTAPLGYNPYLDELLFGGGVEGAQLFAFKRLSVGRWEESEMSDLKGVRYNAPLQNANGLVIVRIRK